MKIMIDINILMDVLQKRHPHFHASSLVLSKVLKKDIAGVIPTHSITTIYYLLKKYLTAKKTIEIIDWLLTHFDVPSLDKSIFLEAKDLKIKDFEDAVVAGLALASNCNYIVSRNVSDFKNSPIKCLSPEELLLIISIPS